MPGIFVGLRGPIFGAAAALAVRRAGGDIISDLVAFGEREVKLQLVPGHGLITGHYRRSINGEVKSSSQGLIHDSGVIYGPWLEGVGRRNKTSRFKGYQMFRKARQKLRAKQGAIAGARMVRLAKDLGGAGVAGRFL